MRSASRLLLGLALFAVPALLAAGLAALAAWRTEGPAAPHCGTGRLLGAGRRRGRGPELARSVRLAAWMLRHWACTVQR